MSTWLSYTAAAAMVELSVAADSDVAWQADVDAACAWVEPKRPDLVTGTPPAFTPTADVKLGTAMLANRLYARRTSPLGTSQNTEFGGSDFLRSDPDIQKMLGIGLEGPFRFGAAPRPEIEVTTL